MFTPVLADVSYLPRPYHMGDGRALSLPCADAASKRNGGRHEPANEIVVFDEAVEVGSVAAHFPQLGQVALVAYEQHGQGRPIWQLDLRVT